MRGNTLMAALAATFVLIAPSLGAADECVCLTGDFELRNTAEHAQGVGLQDASLERLERAPFEHAPLESRATEGDDAQSLPLDVLISAVPAETLRPYEEAPAPLLWCNDGQDPRCQQGQSGQQQLRVVSVASFTLAPQPSLAFRPREHSLDPSFLRRRSSAGPEGFVQGLRRPPRG